jgi:hypothetical protein
MNNYQYEFITTLQYRVKNLQAQVDAFKNGSKYLQMDAQYKSMLHTEECRIHKLEVELSKAHAQTIDVRNKWWDTIEDVYKDHQKEIAAKDARIRALEKRIILVEQQRDAALDKVAEQRRELYEVKTELEEEQGKNLKLTAQINRDYENSSKPSSQSPNHKKISNSREKSGRRPGGQLGHKGHGRKKQAVTEPVIMLTPPKEVLEDPDFKKTGKIIRKQMVNLRFFLEVNEYAAEVYYNSKTGERRHAQFPEGYINDVNYGGSVKALAFILNNECCVSIDKTIKLIADLTSGKLNISKGMVNGLSREFSMKTDKEKKELFASLMKKPVLHTDNTNARSNGNSRFVFIVAAPDGTAQYYFRENKGHAGVKGTPVDLNQSAIFIHDHDTTFYNYGSDHQECIAHILRYCKDSIQNEPDRKWNKKMYELLREMIHYRNGIDENQGFDEKTVSEFEERYDSILEEARKEYEYILPSKYYRDGFNLYSRMKEYRSNHLLFLHDLRVPHNNNMAERLLRAYKHKQHQVMSFRSDASIDYLCQSMSILLSLKQDSESSIYDSVSKIFDRQKAGRST